MLKTIAGLMLVTPLGLLMNYSAERVQARQLTNAESWSKFGGDWMMCASASGRCFETVIPCDTHTNAATCWSSVEYENSQNPITCEMSQDVWDYCAEVLPYEECLYYYNCNPEYKLGGLLFDKCKRGKRVTDSVQKPSYIIGSTCP